MFRPRNNYFSESYVQETQLGRISYAVLYDLNVQFNNKKIRYLFFLSYVYYIIRIRILEKFAAFVYGCVSIYIFDLMLIMFNRYCSVTETVSCFWINDVSTKVSFRRKLCVVLMLQSLDASVMDEAIDTFNII